ncbi:hypothetical protein DPMN_112120 [Dreissena polymorpha]|uniref:B box-type domain-containing protein n=1 Tax=Dreissena polymorpha TaxID=45954 RepID=A0A9D4KG80_DREPO|nr:hypothetical protein DPMN_112120 [Dreissena polymorpha]
MPSNSSDEVRSNQESKAVLCAQCMCNSKEILAVVYFLDCDDMFCEGCGNWHRTSKLSKEHRLSKVEDAPPSDEAQMIQKLTICPNHPSEKVIYFCVEEDKLCCHHCAITNHRKCEHVYLIEECVQKQYVPEKLPPSSTQFSHFDRNIRKDVYKEIKSQVNLEELNDCCKRSSAGLNALENEMEDLITHEASLQAEVTRSHEQVEALLQDMHAKFESAFSSLSIQLKDQCQAKVAELMPISQKKQLAVRSLENQIRKYQDNMRNIKENGKDQHMFLLCYEHDV